jgi:hypothetical protein
LAIQDDGEFVVTWGSGIDYGGSNDTILARRFSSVGNAIGNEFQVNSYTTNFQSEPAVSSTGTGFVVVWNSYHQDGDGVGVFAQRFSRPVTLDVDGDGIVAPLTDGLLVLRFLFGFEGAVLTTGAVGAGCTRCEPQVIVSYLKTLI